MTGKLGIWGTLCAPAPPPPAPPTRQAPPPAQDDNSNVRRPVPPAPAPEPEPRSAPVYKNCDGVRAAGAAPMRKAIPASSRSSTATATESCR